MRRPRRLLLAALVLPLLGCADDDPGPEPIVVTQEAPEESDAEVTDGETAGSGDTDVFPPAAEGVERPPNIIDLRGETRVEVPVGDNKFELRDFRVDPGTEIVFTNVGISRHNVIPAADGAFSPISEDILDEVSATLVLDAPGDYPFFCSIHGTATFGQTGYVIVGDG